MRKLLACLFACTAFAADPKAVVEVCIRNRTAEKLAVGQAREVTSAIFRKVEIRIDWPKGNGDCPQQSIEIQLAPTAPADQRQGVLAYARPFEGRTVVIYLDRVNAGYPASWLSVRLAYVMAHEIGHILQGLSRHSERGIMKARFEHEDDRDIVARRLTFAPEDVSRIYDGIAHRNAANAARSILKTATK